MGHVDPGIGFNFIGSQHVCSCVTDLLLWKKHILPEVVHHCFVSFQKCEVLFRFCRSRVEAHFLEKARQEYINYVARQGAARLRNSHATPSNTEPKHKTVIMDVPRAEIHVQSVVFSNLRTRSQFRVSVGAGLTYSYSPVRLRGAAIFCIRHS